MSYWKIMSMYTNVLHMYVLPVKTWTLRARSWYLSWGIKECWLSDTPLGLGVSLPKFWMMVALSPAGWGDEWGFLRMEVLFTTAQSALPTLGCVATAIFTICFQHSHPGKQQCPAWCCPAPAAELSCLQLVQSERSRKNSVPHACPR